MKQEEKNRRSRELIELAAIQGFAQQGFEQANLNQICRDNQISKGKLYHYYASKNELISACAQRIAAEIRADIQAFVPDANQDVEANLHDCYQARIGFWRRQSDAFLFIYYCLTSKDEELCADLGGITGTFGKEMQKKILEIFAVAKVQVKAVDDRLLDTLQVMYDRFLVQDMHRVIQLERAGDLASADQAQQALMEHYDRLNHILLYGILA